MGRHLLIWVALLAVLALPVAVAAFSPLLAYRQPVYIMAGFSGIIGLALMPLQPLAAGRKLPGLSPVTSRHLHRWLGISLLSLIVLHVAGLWVFSPPDVIDALLLRSPTPFSIWGVLAMWIVFATATLALLRRRLKLKPLTWKRTHMTLAALAVASTAAHALLIEGTMEQVTKVLLSGVAVLLTAQALLTLGRGRRAQGPPEQ